MKYLNISLLAALLVLVLLQVLSVEAKPKCGWKSYRPRGAKKGCKLKSKVVKKTVHKDGKDETKYVVEFSCKAIKGKCKPKHRCWGKCKKCQVKVNHTCQLYEKHHVKKCKIHYPGNCECKKEKGKCKKEKKKW